MSTQISAMKKRLARSRFAGRRFLKGGEGNVTIEYMIWIPFLFMFLMLILDVSMTLHKYTRMWDVARDAARTVATGGDKVAAANMIKSSLSNSADYVVIVDNTTNPERVVVTIDAVGSSTDFRSVLDVVNQVDLFTRYTVRNEVPSS